MTYRSAEDILQEADTGGMRRAFIVTPLLLEMEAVRGHLRPLGSVMGRAGKVYECGVFSDLGNDWLVVVIETGPGTHAAHSAVTDANSLFPNFEVQIVVGIGGSRKSDAPLGSVVASDHVYTPYSAKYSDGRRSGRPRTFPVDPRLIGIARKVRRDNIWPNRIRDPDNGRPPQIDAYPMDWPPVGLIAPIASVEAVLADPGSELEALIADVCDDTCVVEMEGYGAVYASFEKSVPCIVVRGVSDMTQDKSPERDAERQPVAACHAAAFAFEMLSHWAQTYPLNVLVAPGVTPTPEVAEIEYESLDAMRAQLASASAELMAWPNALPDGETIDRPELGQLIERLDASTASTTAVLGPPGAGKSALLATLAHRYVESGWPVLGIKGDLLYAGISTEEDLQKHLALDALPSVLLQRLAKFQPVLLILDQLDALAGCLDLRTARLSVLLSLVRRLGRIDNVHIVLSSRDFEFEHDVRLKAVSTKSLSLQLPAWSQILALLEARGVRAAGWPEDAQEVMRSPQALATYLKLEGRQDSEAFTSYQAMLDELWQERVLSGNDGDRRGQLASEIADQMASDESLWLARARFDDRGDDIAALEAAGVLVTSKGSLGFKHQTLFEYALARSFARQKGRLAGYVLERQTSLFFRSKLWAGLSYLRAVDINTYHAELEAIWTAPDLRKHLRFLLIDFLGHQKQPTDREALLMEQALRLPEQRWPAYRALRGSPGWFERFRRTFIDNSMCESDEAANAMVDVLASAWPFAEDNVVEFLRDRWASDPNYDLRSWMVLHRAPRWTDAVLEVACNIVGRTGIALHLIDYVVGTIGVEQPETALYLVRARLDHDLAVARAKAEELSEEAIPERANMKALLHWQLEKDHRDPLRRLVDHGQGWESLSALAEQAPRAFLEILWPWFEQYFTALKARTKERQGRLGYTAGLNADFRFEEENDNLPEPALLSGLRTAAESLAQTDPDAWMVWVGKFGASDIEPLQRLIAHCFASSPEQFATEALMFLLEDPRRYILGSLSNMTSTSSRLVEKAGNHWTEQETASFEIAVRSYGPPAPPDLTEAIGRRHWNWSVRRIRLSLLRALPKNRLTAKMRRHVEKEERGFPDPRLGTSSTGVQFIGSMMDAAAIAHASDKDVINAFHTVPDASGWNHPHRLMVGGNIQLSREFATFSKENPTRAIRLLGSLDHENGTRAAGYALDAMSEGAASDQVLLFFRDVVSRGFDSEGFRGSASRAIVRLVDRKAVIRDDIVAILEGWLAAPQTGDVATDKVDPDTDVDTGLEAANAESEEQEDCIQRSALWGYGGISRVPGGEYPVLEALIRIRLEREEFDRIDEMLRVHLDYCKDLSVWAYLLRFVPYLHPTEPARRAALLDRLFTEIPTLVETQEATRLLANAHWWNPDFANIQLDRWRDSESRFARQAYGEIVAVAALMQPTLSWAQTRLESLVEDQALEDARVGAALTAANAWSDANRRPSAGDLLTRLLAAGGEDVWRAAFDLFRLVDELTPDPPTVSLLTMIADQIDTVPPLYANFMVERLGTLLPHQAVLVGRVAEGLIAAWREELGDVRTGTAAAAPQLVDLAVTLHRLGPETREIGTALFEQLIEIDAWEARKTLDEIDSRFLEQAPPRRPRLARRSNARNR